ncbi:hypothetical protein JCM1840_004725 [Sporobolomyces johnsonii]
MSTAAPLTLEAAITPSRAGLPPPKAKKGGKGGDDELLPDFIAPEPKNAGERREWDRMSSRMDGFHSYFRQAFKQLWVLADGSFEKRGLSLQDFMEMASEFVHHLEFHHGLEQAHIFPILAKRMSVFGEEHLEEHDAIHHGMEELESIIKRVRSNPSSYSPTELRTNLAAWGPILFYHLDAEVASLKPDVLRRYYTLEEVKRLPM